MRYFFNQIDGAYDPYSVGEEFATFNEARVEAVRFAAAVLRDHPTLVRAGQDFRIEVTDANRLILFTVIVVGVDAPAARTLASSLPERISPANQP